jgi:hypothetical protein
MENLNMSCRCCNNKVYKIFSGELLKKEVQYFECENCGYVQTETPTWLDKAYANPISPYDTGIMERNVGNSRLVSGVIKLLKIKDSTVVDFAGGYGILVRLLRDRGINALWSDGYCKNLLATGFEYENQEAELATAFEVFEHFVEPQIELIKLFNISPNILISTCIIPTPTPKPKDWWYFGQEHGQHIGFYRLKTLKYLAEKNNKYLYSDKNSIHLFTTEKVSTCAWRFLLFKLKIIPYIKSKYVKSLIMDDYYLSILINK